MKNPAIKKLVLTAVCAAMICAATMVVQIPIGVTGGYVNMGDALVLLTSFLLGPACGAAAGGIGSALADLLSGYAVFAPATLIIKAGIGCVAGLLYSLLMKKTNGKKPLSAIAAGVCGEIIMVAGYFVFAAVFILHSVAGASAEVVGNLVQATFGIIVAVVLNSLIKFKLD